MATLSTPKHIRWWFRGAALYGVLALVPQYFMAQRLAAAGHPVTHPESYYGFIGTALAFQLVFWMIGGDPARYRAIMPFAACEKLAFAVPVVLLYAAGQADRTLLGFALFDLLLGAGFLICWRATPAA